MKPGTRVRLNFGWPSLEQHVDGVLTGYRNSATAVVRFDGDDYNTIVGLSELSLAPPRGADE